MLDFSNCALRGFKSAGKEAWKKRTFFPEDIVNSNYFFHDVPPFKFIPSPHGRERARVRKNKKKPFIHNRDEEFSPRYHPVYREAKWNFAPQSL